MPRRDGRRVRVDNMTGPIPSDDAIATVTAWLAAVNDGDVTRVLALSADDVEIVGPRGAGRGTDLLRRWLAQAGASFHTLRVFADGDRVVVAQHATWRDEDGSITGEAQVASRFRVVGGRVAQVERHSELANALTAASLGEETERRQR